MAIIKSGNGGTDELTVDPVSKAARVTLYDSDGTEQSALPVSGTVTVSNPVTTISVNNFPSTQPVSGTVSVSNPQTSVSVSNLPATQQVSGTVTVSNPQSTVSVSNFPSSTEINNDSGNPIPVSGTFFQATQPVSGTVAVNNHPTTISVSNFPSSTEISNDSGNPVPVNGTVTISNPVSTVSISNFPGTQPISATSLPLATGAATSANQTSQIASLASVDSKLPSALVNDRLKVEALPVPDTLAVTAVGAAAAAVTLTLPAVVGQFQLIDSIEISLYSSAARTGVATPITVTTTNLPGNLAYTFATAGVIGSCDTRQLNNANRPIRSLTANTATTIVCPAVTGGVWRINVTYSTSA